MMRSAEKLLSGQSLTREDFLTILSSREQLQPILAPKAREVCAAHYGQDIYVRGLIEFTNYCKNDCFYCGIRRSNRQVTRYRLTEEEILDRCRVGFDLGFRTFVLQGGEDPGYPPERIARLVASIKAGYPQCAVTLSVGEQPRQVYQTWFDAGADRYLLRHETADPCHYQRLHPGNQTLQSRLECLQSLKEIGYQVGCGFMVGSPGQGDEQLARDLLLIQSLRPHMVGIGPFIPHHNTPFAGEAPGSVELTVYLLSVLRLMLPQVLLPATTALATLHPGGRGMGFLAGANVCMPNLSPERTKEHYALYDNKLSTGTEAAGSLRALEQSLQSIGRRLSMDRGDHIQMREE